MEDNTLEEKAGVLKDAKSGSVITDEEQIEAVKHCTSINGLLRYLGKPVSSGQHLWAKRRIQCAGIDISHFTGRGSRMDSLSYTTDELFAEGSKKKRSTVRKRILRDNLIPYECAFCGNTGEWMGHPMALELDHINGVANDHRLENLRFLCPNCHATTDTYCGRNMKKGSSSEEKCVKPFRYKPLPENALHGYDNYSKQKQCHICGQLISNSAKTCRQCFNNSLRKTNVHEMPSMDLAKLVVDNGIAGVAKLYNVSESTVARWCVEHGMPKHKAEIIEWYNQRKDNG